MTIHPYLSKEELETRYRKARDAVEKSHWQMLWLLAQGKSSREVAEVTGYYLNWIHILVRRYNQQGPQAIIDHRHRNPGAAPLLSAEQQAQLVHALDAPAPDSGLWGEGEDRTAGGAVDPDAHWAQGSPTAWLRVSQTPELQQACAASTPHQSRSYCPRGVQKTLPEQVKAVQQAFPQATVELWATDQHRVGLKPMVRRIWVRKGSRPQVTVQHR